MIRAAASAWLGLLVVAPLVVVGVIAFAVPDQGLPPFRFPSSRADGWVAMNPGAC